MDGKCVSRWMLAASLLATLATAWPAMAQTGTSREPTLRQRLVSGLQVRRPSEFAFIDAVLATVERGELPQKLVDRFFFWARKRIQKGPRTHRAIIYFQPALTIQAKRLGISITASP